MLMLSKRKFTLLALSSAVALTFAACHSGESGGNTAAMVTGPATKTPIKHVVVIYQENVSYDHYFATYPNAANPTGEPVFTAAPNTPSANGLSGSLLTANPNFTNTANGVNAANPFRLDRSQAATADQNHNYYSEQLSYDNGLMDLFPKNVGTASTGGAGAFGTRGQVMGYYDGNTVTAFWNYAQHYAMSDNSYSTTFGPSTQGALNLVSGQTNGAVPDNAAQMAADGAYGESTDNNGNLTAILVPDGNGSYSAISDGQPTGDVCTNPAGPIFHMTGTNIGDLLNAKGITWGFFQGGFDLTVTNPNGTTGCKRTSSSAYGATKNKVDYIPHHEPFQYYASTQNLQHTRPSSVAAIGTSTDGANHQYDIHDFFDALNAGNMPAVSFLKAPGYQDGHAGYSTPLDEQEFLVNTINAIQNSPFWKDTAIVIAYDDSDGWYDHAVSPIVNGSNVAKFDGLSACTNASTPVLAGVNGKPAQGRCGYGPRQPLLVISPYAKQNFIDHTVTDQSSILKFVEDNWLGGQRIAGSFDNIAGTIENMFNFSGTPNTTPVILDSKAGTVSK